MVHIQANTGYAKASDTYVSGRPDYPAAVDGWLAGTLGLRDGITVLDLGAGTGKFTKRLVETGASVIAVEPVAAMREKLGVLDVTALDGSAERIPLGDASVDVVICAQAFHWFATREALAEIHRVLKPDGRLGLIWNVRDETVPWVAELTDIMAPYEGDTPRFHTGAWREAFTNSEFGELNEQQFPHAHIGPPEQVVMDRVMSVSFIAALSVDEQLGVRDKVNAVIRKFADLDKAAFPYVTTAYSCWKSGREGNF